MRTMRRAIPARGRRTVHGGNVPELPLEPNAVVVVSDAIGPEPVLELWLVVEDGRAVALDELAANSDVDPEGGP